MATPLFSVIHASARPSLWRESWLAWTHRCEQRSSCEYLLVVDRWQAAEFHQTPIPADVHLTCNHGRRCCVDAYNVGASQALGDVLILNSDDMFPPVGWDRLLQESIGNRWGREFVVRCKTGPTTEIHLQILSRTRYERLGYALYPEYVSVSADVEFTLHAEKDGCVIEAPLIEVEHKHPTYPGGWPWDAVYARENAKENYEIGYALLERRRRNGFPPLL